MAVKIWELNLHVCACVSEAGVIFMNVYGMNNNILKEDLTSYNFSAMTLMSVQARQQWQWQLGIVRLESVAQ